MPSIRLFCIILSCLSWPLQAATVLVFGDSLSAGYGLQPGQGWVSLLERELATQHRVVNASQSGETTAGGLSRLPRTLSNVKPDWVILELGGNDGLRGLPIAAMRANLGQMIALCQRAGAKVLLVGISLPPNYGMPYSQAFHGVFDGLARQYRLAYVPQMMQGFSGDLSQFQPDGIHPAAAAQKTMLRTIKAKLKL